MMTTHTTLLLACSTLFIFSLHLLRSCDAHCTPSACGIIGNISYPFRLKGDPDHCGDRNFELVCENNVTYLYHKHQKYYVKDINYQNKTIRLVDASITNETCSFPNYSAPVFDSTFASDNFVSRYFYEFPYSPDEITEHNLEGIILPIYFIRCPLPLKNSCLFTDITDCASHPKYVKLGLMEVPEACEVDLITVTSWSGFRDWNNVSLSEIHKSLLYGFQVQFCPLCGIYPSTTWEKIQESGFKIRDVFVSRFSSPVLLIPAIAVMLCAAVAPPVMAIISIAAVLGLLYFIGYQLDYRRAHAYGFDDFQISNNGRDPLSSGFVSSAMLVCTTRFIIYPLVIWILIYKFRRRHLSEFATVESFLQSDNKLMPIRYSYSQIKKMTRGFRHKLGEGGFGSVYKGKTRSGHHVAVKLLKKSGGNGQDFMNEIATIGRIHHVNIVTLVGYCAQGSKRALVFDFMPNGSLDKYLFNRENSESLNWERKFEIAVGVARGIEYLHQGCDIQILHFDIKPHNILLDDKFVPKISDFGLAKFCSTEKKTMTMTAIRGTIGYVAPELINRGIGQVSYKADVYSFGMMLMEMAGLNREMTKKDDESSKYFPCWIYDQFDQGMDIEIGSFDENDNSDVKKLVRKMTIVALWCIKMNPDDRPSMSKVLNMLEGDVERLKIPEYPSRSSYMAISEDESSLGTCSNASVSLAHHNVAMPSVEIIIEE